MAVLAKRRAMWSRLDAISGQERVAMTRHSPVSVLLTSDRGNFVHCMISEFRNDLNRVVTYVCGLSSEAGTSVS